MQVDYSKSALERFLDYVENKGLVGLATAQGWRVAAAKITDDLSASETADVRQIDVDLAFRRFNNKHANKYTPKTLSEYRKRAASAIQNFVEWAGAPEAYQPKGRPRGAPKKGDAPGKKGSKPNSPPQVNDSAISPSNRIPEPDILAMPFPIRAGMLAHVSVPRDMSVEEARRLGAFLLTLAADYKAGP